MDEDSPVPFSWIEKKELHSKVRSTLGTSLDGGILFFPEFWGDLWIQPRCGREEESHGKVQSCWGFFPPISVLDPSYKILFSPCQITAPYLHIGAITIMVLLSWPMALHAIRADKKGIVTLLPAPCMTEDARQWGKTNVKEPLLPYPHSSWSWLLVFEYFGEICRAWTWVMHCPVCLSRYITEKRVDVTLRDTV